MNKLLVSFLALIFLLSCDSAEENTVQELFINLSKVTVEFGNNSSEKSIVFETNLPKIVATSDSKDWCNATIKEDTLIINVTAYQGQNERTATIQVKGEGASETVTVIQQGDVPTHAIVDDIRIPVTSATAAFFNPGNEIEKSFDGNYQTYFMSHWTQTTFPFDIVYNFTDVPSMDYIIYYPRGSASGTGSNGLLGKLEVWYATKDNATFVKHADYDFMMSSSAQKIQFATPLINPTQIKLALHKGMGTGTYAAIGEMEFYRKNPESFDYTSIFTDASCSELKNNITKEQIDAIDNSFFKYLAIAIYNQEYDLESRVREYKAWQHPSIMAEINRTEKYSLLDNPTGIYVKAGDELVVLAADFGNVNLSLQAIDLSTGGAGTRIAYALSKGVNKINITSDGLLYVLYHTNAGTEPPVKINFVTGKINGCFYKSQHTNADWKSMLDNAVSPYMDVVGDHAHLTFPVADFKTHTPDVEALIDTYDKLVYQEMDFMGLVKYNKMFKNRMYFHIDTNPQASYMYATAYRTAYSIGTMSTMCGLSKPGANYWGPAHEVGHVNQLRPEMKWQGTTEVTNNIYSLHIQQYFGATSRLITDNVYGKFVTNPSANTIIGGNLAHAQGDIWEKLVPFWQLKLYLMDALGKTDFYRDLFENYRVNPEPASGSQTEGYYQLAFVRNTCRIANLDLTAFFEKWGFLRPVSLNIDDYGNQNFVITQQQINDLKAEIAAANYPKPAHNNIHLITDANVNSYND